MKTKIFFSCYEEEQKAQCPETFEVIECEPEPPPYPKREFPILRNIYNSGALEENDYCGLFAPTAFEKFKKHSSDSTFNDRTIFDFIESNKGYDVYLFNPFASDVINLDNVWIQAEGCHQGLTQIAQKLIDEASYFSDDKNIKKASDIKISSISGGVDNHSMCNYWVGNKKFWDKYISFVGDAFDFVHSDNISSELDQALRGKTVHGNTFELWSFPFIIERMTSTLIFLDSDIKSIGWFNPELKHLLDQKEE